MRQSCFVLLLFFVIPSLKSIEFYFSHKNIPAGTQDLPDDPWKDNICCVKVFYDKEKTKTNDNKAVIINFEKAKPDTVCDHKECILIPMIHTKNQGEECSNDVDCLYNNCKSKDGKKTCQVAEINENCSTHTFNEVDYPTKCAKGSYCANDKCASLIKPGEICELEESCTHGYACGNLEGKENMVCMKMGSVADGTEINEDSEQSICKNAGIVKEKIENKEKTLCATYVDIKLKEDGKKCVFTYKAPTETDKTATKTWETTAFLIKTKKPITLGCLTMNGMRMWAIYRIDNYNKTLNRSEWIEYQIKSLREEKAPRYEGADDEVIRYMVGTTRCALGVILLMALLGL